MTNITIINHGEFTYNDENGNPVRASFPLYLIHRAWNKGCSFELLADGFGKGYGTMGDWSAIRDSSEKAIAAMFKRALEFFGIVPDVV
jgi:hypothetical protein